MVLDPVCLLLGVPVTPRDSVPLHVVVVVCSLPVSAKDLSYCLGSQRADCIPNAKQGILALPHVGCLVNQMAVIDCCIGHVDYVSGRPITVAHGKYAVRVQSDDRGCQAVTEDAVEKRLLGLRQSWQNGAAGLVYWIQVGQQWSNIRQ